jgi:hypothetical protein
MYNKFRGLNPKELLKHDWLKQGRKRKKKKTHKNYSIIPVKGRNKKGKKYETKLIDPNLILSVTTFETPQIKRQKSTSGSRTRSGGSCFKVSPIQGQN